MEPVLFVMAIMGCGDGQAMCSEVRTVRAEYTSVQACQAAMPAVLAANTDLEYPELTAACRRTTPVMADARGARRGG